MAWNEDGYAIQCAGAGYGASCLGHSHLIGQSAVSPSLSLWNLAKRLPDAKLKSRAAEIERKRVTGRCIALCANGSNHRGHGLAQLWIGVDGCCWKLGAQACFEFRFRLSQSQPADAAVSGSDNDGAELP